MADAYWGCDQSVLMHYWIDRVGVGFVKNCFFGYVQYPVLDQLKKIYMDLMQVSLLKKIMKK
jgi:hypothetical protein